MSTAFVPIRDKNSDAFHQRIRLMIQEMDTKTLINLDELNSTDSDKLKAKESILTLLISSHCWSEEAINQFN